MTVMRVVCIVVMGVGLLAGCQTVSKEPIPGARLGFVLMHGKGSGTGYLDPLASTLRDVGVLVETPAMPWSRGRIYDRTYDEALLEIDAAVARLKAKGAKRIVVGGQSMGANVALGYGARRKGLAGIVLLAYGHVPSGNYFTERLAAHVARAQSMIASGAGDRTGAFGDINQRVVVTRQVSAKIYHSWFDPDGPASDRNNAWNADPNTPILWVSGDQDRVSRFGKRLIWSKLPGHAKSKFIVIASDHRGTLADSTDIVANWLRGL